MDRTLTSVEEELKGDHNLMMFNICTENCISDYTNKIITANESMCLNSCFSKLKEADKIIDKIINNN